MSVVMSVLQVMISAIVPRTDAFPNGDSSLCLLQRWLQVQCIASAAEADIGSSLTFDCNNTVIFRCCQHYLCLVGQEVYEARKLKRACESVSQDDKDTCFGNNVKMQFAQLILAAVDTYFAGFELYELTLPPYEAFFRDDEIHFSGQNLVIEESNN